MGKNSFARSGIALAVSGVVLLQGCATELVQKAEKRIEDVSGQASERFVAASKKEVQPLVTRTKSVWVADKQPLPPVVNPVDSLPEIFTRKVSYNLQGRYTLQEILAKVTAEQKVMTSINPDIGELTQQGAAGASQAQSAQGQPLYTTQGMTGATAGAGGAGNLPPLPNASAPATLPSVTSLSNLAQAANRLSPVIVDDLVYSGPLFGLLDMLSSKTNLSWRWIGGRIEFFKYETKIFYVTTLAGGSKMSSTINAQSSSSSGSTSSGSGGTNSGSTSSSGQVVQTSVDLNEWPALLETIKSGLTPKGKVVVSEQTGMITVTDTPATLRAVDNIVKEFNRQFSKQIMLNVAVYSVDMSESDSAAMDWNAFWQTATSRLGLGYSSVPATGVSTDASGGLIPTTMNGLKTTILRGPWQNTNAIIGALASVGKASLMTRSTVTTLNGKPVPVQVAKETAYLASSQTTLTTGGTASTSLVPGVVTAGFSMNILPKVNDDGKVMMRYTVDLSSLDKMTTFSSGGNSIQLPEKSVRNFMNFASLKSGETLILNGFEQVGAKNDSSGPFNPNAWVLGGSRNATGNRTSVVILITPFVAE